VVESLGVRHARMNTVKRRAQQDFHLKDWWIKADKGGRAVRRKSNV